MHYSHIVGVDEAGRGPLAGPVAVGVVRVALGFDIKEHFPGVNDSKKLTEKARERIFAAMEDRKRVGDLDFCVRFESAHTIDTIGISAAVKKAVWEGVECLAPTPGEVKVFLDGLLSAPPVYAQETIIKGDALVPVISLASIAAKVSRDQLMRTLAAEYPQYAFDVHKGYGTKKHYEALAQWGPSSIHRRTFID